MTGEDPRGDALPDLPLDHGPVWPRSGAALHGAARDAHAAEHPGGQAGHDAPEAEAGDATAEAVQATALARRFRSRNRQVGPTTRDCVGLRWVARSPEHLRALDRIR